MSENKETVKEFEVYQNKLSPLHIGMGVGAIGISIFSSIALAKYLDRENVDNNVGLEILKPIARAGACLIPLATTVTVGSKFMNYERKRVAKEDYYLTVNHNSDSDVKSLLELVRDQSTKKQRFDDKFDMVLDMMLNKK